MKRILILFLLIILIAGCSPSGDPNIPQAPKGVNPQKPAVHAGEGTEITVLAAASLTEPFSEIGVMFEAAHPGLQVNFSFSGSQQLARQISEGAPVDVFACASQKYLDAVISSGQVNSADQVIFARNRLVVITPLENPAAIRSLQDLARPGVKIDLATAEVPVGKYSLEFLDHASINSDFGAGYPVAVLVNVVSYEDNVKAVLTKVMLGEADAGIVYNSDVNGKEDTVHSINIPDDLNVIASYPIARTRMSSQPELAQLFVELVLSPEGQAVLSRYGFIPVK